MDRILRLNEFFVEGGKQDISHVLLQITEPSTPEEMAKGYFFAIAEINNAETKYITRLQELIDKAENDYYEVLDEGDKNSLEIVLEKLNQEALTLVKPDIELHCIIGAIRQPEIIFTYYGRPQMVLFYKNQQNLYQKLDLLQGNGEEEETPSQLFSQIIQGKITSNDFLFAGTPHIVEYFSHDRLQKIITSRPAVQSAQHIERVLSDLRNGFSFGGLIMHIDRADSGPVQVKKAPTAVKGASSKSLHNLFDRERNTANTLSASLFPRLNDRMKAMFNPEAEETVATATAETPRHKQAEINSNHVTHRLGSAVEEPGLAWRERLGIITRGIVKALRVVGEGIWNIVYFIYTLLYSLARNFILLILVASNYQNRRKTILEDWRRNWRGYRENVRQLPLITKALLFGSIIVAVVFAMSILVIRYHQKQAARTKAFQETVQMIKAKKDAMESALIYKDEAAALTELTSAKELLKNTTCVTKDEKTTCAALQKDLDELTTRVRKVTTVTPELLATLPVSLDQVVKINTKLLGFATGSSTVLIYDLLTKEVTNLTLPAGVTSFAKASVPKENDYLVLSYGDRGLVKFDPADNSLKPAEISYTNDKVTISDITVYNRRLYTLDTTNNQIYKHDSTKNGFGQGKDWIKDGTQVREGYELTIDGDMFVLKHNGEITKFAAGVSQPFVLQGVDPTLGDGTTLWTYTDLRYMYALDPTNKRLVILEKDGRLKAQLTAAEFNYPSGLAVDPTNNTAYIIDGTRLFKVTLPQ